MKFKMWLEAEEAKFKPKLKLFGAAAERVNKTEMEFVLQELQSLLQGSVEGMELVKSLDSKLDHGDIDILIISNPNLKEILSQRLGGKLLEYSKNGNTTSFLFDSSSIGKKVHVDFIASKNSEELDAKRIYYALNDVSAIVGMVVKKMNFKYGTEGIFKRFQDKQGIWNDIPISKNLYDGMIILGFDISKYNKIKDYDDILRFVTSSPMVDSSFFRSENMVSRDRRSLGIRAGLDYLVDKLANMNIQSKIVDEDYFFKKNFGQKYIEVEKAKQAINSKKYTKSNKYNGEWIMSNFGISPGKQVGFILKALSDRYGGNLENAPETEVFQFVKSIIQ